MGIEHDCIPRREHAYAIADDGLGRVGRWRDGTDDSVGGPFLEGKTIVTRLRPWLQNLGPRCLIDDKAVFDEFGQHDPTRSPRPRPPPSSGHADDTRHEFPR